MRQSSTLILAVLVVQAYSAPQFITFKEGKLGVNFGGYHAGVGLGGLVGGEGRTAGGLYAEAGTPFGQGAKAGLGGAVDGKSGTAGGLYAGATAGGNVKASAGLGGIVDEGKTVGGGYSSAQAGGKTATSVLGGESGVSGSSEFSISAHKSIGVPTTVVKETEVSVIPVKSVEAAVQGESKLEAANEITSSGNADLVANAHVNVNAQPEIVKEVHVQPAPVETVYLRKHKPHRHHFHKTVYVGGYAGLGGEAAAPVTKTVYKTVQPIEKRVDVDVEAHAGAGANVNGEHHGAGQGVTYNKEITVNANAKPSTFFQDIFNIPISTLKAVSGFLSNTAGNTGISVQKSATINTDSDITSKHDTPSQSSSSSSEAHISVMTPNASSFIDDIFSIPINTLSAVNKFLENNVAGRKRVQVTSEVAGEPTRIRLGPHARRRANKQVVIVQEPAEENPQESN